MNVTVEVGHQVRVRETRVRLQQHQGYLAFKGEERGTTHAAWHQADRLAKRLEREKSVQTTRLAWLEARLVTLIDIKFCKPKGRFWSWNFLYLYHRVLVWLPPLLAINLLSRGTIKDTKKPTNLQWISWLNFEILRISLLSADWLLLLSTILIA